MNKKVVLPIIFALLLIAGAIGFLFLFNSTDSDEDVTQIDITAQTLQNKGTVFDFLTKERYELPDNMRGFVIDLETDIDFSKSDEQNLKTACDNIFSKVDAILPNTVLIKYASGFEYSAGGFDVLTYFIELCGKNKYDVFLLLPENTDVQAVASKYIPAGIVTAPNSLTEQLKTELNSKNIKAGIIINAEQSEKASSVLAFADFCFIQINTTLAAGAENHIKTWASAALKTQAKIYAILRNELLNSSDMWSDTDEIYNQVRAVYNYGGFSGCVMNSHAKLQNNENDLASDLYFYNEYFNDIDYTALTLTDFAIENNNFVVFKGTSDKNFPIHTFSVAQNGWQTVTSSGENGEFTAKVALADGENKIVIKHKNAMYTYHIDKVVDVLINQNAVIDGDKITLTATAHKGAAVWAAIANTEYVELVKSDENGNYATFTAVYTIPDQYKNITSENISFAATYGGINDLVISGEAQKITPYNDHGLGTSTICVVTKDYTEATSTQSPDDTSDPTCTPQLSGAYAYVAECGVKDNIVIYSTDMSMKIHGEKSRLILDGYKMPQNSVTVTDIKNNGTTTVTFKQKYPTFTQIAVSPQEYFTGSLERVYNVESFTGEYVDIMFLNTAECAYTQQPDFTGSTVISKAEWYTNTEKGFVTMRLYLKNKSDFAGYSMTQNTDGTLSITLKKTTDYLEGTVIMIDPGHGGYGAPGTYSTSSVYEHEVVLSIAEKTAKILRDHGATVIITRQSDDSLFLDERVELIRRYNPDIFISIHCDGSENADWKGTHTFYYKNYSMPLASAIHNEMLKTYRTNVYTNPDSAEYDAADKGCKFFPYMVTRVEECPSVLIECGYLTNPTDALFLTSENGQAAIATAIAQGIVNYIEN